MIIISAFAHEETDGVLQLSLSLSLSLSHGSSRIPVLCVIISNNDIACILIHVNILSELQLVQLPNSVYITGVIVFPSMFV